MLRRSTSAGNTTMTVYAFGLEEHLYSGSGVHQINGDTYYYSLGGMLVGESTGTTTNMFLTDALGSVLETISATANTATVQGNQVYSPYGSSRYQQGSMGTAKGFTGQYNESGSGLDYYGSRYYDPVVGRFLSADALDGNLAGMDPYAYVGGNPETFNDPSGQRYAPPPGGGGGNPALNDPQACFNPQCEGPEGFGGGGGGDDSGNVVTVDTPPPPQVTTPQQPAEPWYAPVVRIVIGIAAGVAYVSGQAHSLFTHPSPVDAAESINLVLPLGINSVGWANFHRSVGGDRTVTCFTQVEPSNWQTLRVRMG